jgi:uncharacterized protein YndB with AHSA1/START domain
MEIPKPLVFEGEIDAPAPEVWQAWTTEDGVKTFFAPACHIDLRIGGAYEMYFNLESGEGDRGGEGCVLLAIDEPNMLSFTWNAPPEYPHARMHRTHVTVYLESTANKKTLLKLSHDGWGCSEEWFQVQRYFERAWGEVVLPRLQQRFVNGPIQWEE